VQKNDRKILLTFDVEEFDVPLEYGHALSTDEQLATGKHGLDNLQVILDRPGISCTLFTTAFFGRHFPASINALASKHEIASHTYYHSKFAPPDLLTSRLELERIAGKKVSGLRMPRMNALEPGTVLAAGYRYDASIHPTWIPGRYMHLRTKRTVHESGGMLQVPASVTPHLRIPLFWLSFKNLPYPVFKRLALRTLKHDGYLSLYFHPWEFTRLEFPKVPYWIRKRSGHEMLDALNRFIQDFSGLASFTTVEKFLDTRPE